jgi:hypothetical protein
MSGTLMYCLLVAYGTIAAVSLYERNFPRACYWISAAGITASVLWMAK